MKTTVRVVDTLLAIAPDDWNRLAGDDPFLRHEFLSALHETGCASAETGWAPVFITVWQGDALQAAMPLYVKSHSYGEYVFDWAWADAYQRHGQRYYPKLLGAVPFTPVTGSRLLTCATGEARDNLVDSLTQAALDLARDLDVSSLHILFPPEREACALKAAGLLVRQGVQFRWRNRIGLAGNDTGEQAAYASFDDFLSELNHAKRKKIRQERRKVGDAGIRFEWLRGGDISDAHWTFFNRCYRNTYRQHHSTPYLNLAFFRRLGRTMSRHVLLIVALRDNEPIAAALNLCNSATVYGRYWGALEYHPGLHFETCYYQAIEFCIANHMRTVEGGAQGEHKLARGFLPAQTWSAHWLAHPEFAAAIEHYLARETCGIAGYLDELHESSPFKSGAGY
ncbi:MAG: GNAT family N-acetyltransferase [Pseudomonadota bacterium]|nr:GNAT family N-acetyltransferase [Pseudomonadota bacterium]